MIYHRFPKIPETKVVDGMIDLISNKIEISEKSVPSESDQIFFVGGFRTSLDHINTLKHSLANFINIDKGYLYNQKVTNFWRMTFNDFQQRKIIEVPSDRLNDVSIKPWRKTGSYILILAPNPDPLLYYENQIIDNWIRDIKIKLLSLTDRKIFIRYKDNKKIRSHDPLAKYLDDCYVVVSLQSIGCIESIIEGVPCINLAPSCLDGLYESNLNNIENLEYPENRFEWLKTLSYSQFTWDEMKNGTAIDILKDLYKW